MLALHRLEQSCLLCYCVQSSYYSINRGIQVPPQKPSLLVFLLFLLFIVTDIIGVRGPFGFFPTMLSLLVFPRLSPAPNHYLVYRRALSLSPLPSSVHVSRGNLGVVGGVNNRTELRRKRTFGSGVA